MDAMGAVLQLVLAVLSLGCLVYVLLKLASEKSALHAVLGFLFPIYPFGWGWLNGRRLEILDVMAFWTAITLMALVFPAALAWASLASDPGWLVP